MTPQMVATRNALPLNSTAALMYIRDMTATADAANATVKDSAEASLVVSSAKSRDSMRAKLSRKVKSVFSNKTDRQSASEADDLRKEANRRQFVESGAFVQMSRR